jgi:GT2 family glycosyltransferase
VRAHLGDADYVLILDQDTRLPQDFVATALAAAHANALPSVIAAHMLAGDRIASPCRLALGWGRRWAAPRPGWQSLRANTLINSGAWIHRRVFVELGVWYNESLALYGTDTDFFRRLGRLEPRLFVLPLQVAHDLSFDAASVDEKAAKIDAMLAANRAIYAADGWMVRAGLRCMNALVRLRYAVRYRTVRFL